MTFVVCVCQCFRILIMFAEGNDKQNESFKILNKNQIIFNITVFDKEVDDYIETSVFNLKSTNCHLEAEAMLSKCMNWYWLEILETNTKQLLLLRKIRNFAAQKTSISKKMTDYLV